MINLNLNPIGKRLEMSKKHYFDLVNKRRKFPGHDISLLKATLTRKRMKLSNSLQPHSKDKNFEYLYKWETTTLVLRRNLIFLLSQFAIKICHLLLGQTVCYLTHNSLSVLTLAYNLVNYANNAIGISFTIISNKPNRCN